MDVEALYARPNAQFTRDGQLEFGFAELLASASEPAEAGGGSSGPSVRAAIRQKVAGVKVHVDVQEFGGGALVTANTSKHGSRQEKGRRRRATA